MKHQAVFIAAGLAAILAACSSGADKAASPPTSDPITTTTVSTSTTTAVEPGPLVVSWTEDFEARLPNGWTVRECDGARTHVCVFDGDVFLGDIELNPGYPLSPEDDPSDAEATAETWARNMIDTFRDDRGTACPDFTFETLDVTSAVVGGQPGARGGFEIRDGGGRIVEHVINHYVLTGDTMTIINADAYALEGGCLPPSDVDPSFTPEALEELEPYLDRLVADSPAVIE